MLYKSENSKTGKDIIYFRNSDIFSGEEEMSYYAQLFLVNYGLPTLLKMKPSNLISIQSCYFSNHFFLAKLIQEVERFRCSYYVLYEDRDMKNVLIYNEEGINKLLTSSDIVRFLTALGYRIEKDQIHELFDTLKSRFERYHSLPLLGKEACFPHEIGILLGYPLYDVEDFIRYRGKNYILSGCWKVYRNAEEAVRVFENYREVKKYAMSELLNGKSLKDIF